MQIRFAVATVLVMLIAHEGQALAAGIDDAGAQRLKQDIKGALDWRLKAAQAENRGLFAEGDIVVSPQGSYYAVTLPKFYFKLAKGERVDIGTIKANVSPGKNDDEWVLSAAVPTPLTFNDADGKALFSFSIGQQKLSAVWHPRADFFPAMEASYKDVVIETPARDVSGKIGLIRTVLELKQENDGTWSGPQFFELSDASFSASGDDSTKLSLEKASGRSLYEKIDITGSMELRRRLLDMAAANPPPSPDEVKKTLREQGGYFRDFADRIANTGQMHAFAMTGKTKSGEPFELRLKDAEFSFDLSDIRAEKAAAVLTASLDGLSFAPLPAIYASVVPQDFTFKAKVSDLPLQKIIEAVVSAATSTAASTQEPGKAPLALQQDVLPMMDLPQTLTTAGARLDISDTALTSTDLQTTLAGSARADVQAQMGATADFTLSFKGLDALVTKLNNGAAAPDAQPSLLAMLTPVQMMGTQGKAADGTPTRSYRFELTPEGKILMNGADMAGIKTILAPPPSTPVPDSPPPSP